MGPADDVAIDMAAEVQKDYALALEQDILVDVENGGTLGDEETPTDSDARRIMLLIRIKSVL